MKRSLEILSILILLSVIVLPTKIFAVDDFEYVDLQVNSEKLLSVSIYNPTTSIPQTTFAPGDEVGYTVTVTIPSKAKDKHATLSLNGTVKVGKWSFTIPLADTLSGPVANPTGKPIDLPSSNVWKGTFKIPSSMSKIPDSKLVITAIVHINGVGTTTCKKKLLIEH